MIRTLACSTAMLLALVGPPTLAGTSGQAAARGGGPARPQAREILPVTAAPVRQFISVTPDIAGRSFRGQTRIELEVPRATNRIVLNALDLTFERAVLAGREAAPAQVSQSAALQQATLRFAQPIPPGRHTLLIDYRGKIADSAAGPFAAPYTVNGRPKTILVTQMEPGDARRLAPMWDEPAIKTVWEMEAVVPSGLDVVSNMPVATTTAAPGGLKRVRFQSTPKMSSYLLFLGVGELDRIAGEAAGVELGIISKRGDGEKGRYALEATGKLLPYFNNYFGAAYPLPKLDQIAVPGAGGFGAMENWGAILYFEPYLLLDPAISTEADRQGLFGTVAHEMAHQWFGNLVTMSWWDDLWLNEGFASWMGDKATGHFNPSWDVPLQALGGRDSAMGLDARATTHPIVQPVANIEQANLAFDTITYQKGQAVITMLEGYLGEEAFRRGVRAYIKQHAYGNTVTADLWRQLDAAAPATPVSAIARDFTTQPGVPLITVESTRCRGGRTVVSLRQGRFGVDAASKRPLSWRTPVVVAEASPRQTPATARGLIQGSGRVALDGCQYPVVVNAGQTGYFRTAYADKEFAALRASFPVLSNVDKLGLLKDGWALGRAGYTPFTRYLDLSLQVATAADPLVQAEVVGDLTALDRVYAPGPQRDRYRAYALGVLRPLFAPIGWTARPGESTNTALLRESLIGALSRLEDPAVIGEARRRFAADDLPTGVRAAAIRTVAAHADARTWDTLRARAAAAASPLEQRLFLTSLARVRDPALAQRTLDLTLTDAVPRQIAPGLIRGVAGDHPDLAWRFYLANRPAVDARLDPLQRLDFAPSLAGGADDPRRAAELQAFAQANIPAGSRSAADQAVSQIRYGAEVRARIRPEIDRWLAARSSPIARR